MASITVDFPNMPQARLNRALADYGAYQPKLEDGTDNPVTRAAYAVLVLKGIVRDIIRQQDREAAKRVLDETPDPELA